MPVSHQEKEKKGKRKRREGKGRSRFCFLVSSLRVDGNVARLLVDGEFRARFVVGHLLENLFVDLFGAFRGICDACVGHALSCALHDLVGFTDATVPANGIPNDTYGVNHSVDDILDAIRVESDDHTGQVVGAEARECMVDKDLGGFLSISDVADEFHGFLVTAHIP